MEIPYKVLFQTLAQQSDDGIVLTDTAGNYLWTNPAFCQMAGYTEAELLARNWCDLLAPANEATTLPKLLGGQLKQNEIQLLPQNQAPFAVEVSSYVIPLPDQVLVLQTLRDKTTHQERQMQMQTQLRLTEQLHQTIAQLNRAQSLEEIYEIAVSGIIKVLAADRSSLLLFGEDQLAHFKAWHNLSPAYRQQTDGHCPWHLHEIEAQPIYYPDVITSDLSEELKQVILDEGIRALLFVPLSRPDRLLGKFMVYFNAPHHWSDQELQLAQVIAQNLAAVIHRVQAMADMERAVAEMRASEENVRQLSRVVETAPVSVIITDAAGYIQYVNPWFTRITGYTSEEALGKSPAILKSGLMPDEVLEELWRTLHTNREWQGEIINKKKNGELYWDLVSISPLTNVTGEITHFVSVQTEITERKRAENLQIAVYQIAQAAERAASLDDLYPEIHAIIQTVMPADNFYIALHDRVTHLIRFPYYVDENHMPTNDVAGHPVRKPRNGWTEYVLRTGVSQLVDDKRHGEMVAQGKVELIGTPAAAWLGVPLIVADTTIGVMVIQHYHNPQAFGERERDMLEYVASQVAQTIDRKQQEEALRQSEEKMRSLARLAQKLEQARQHDDIASPLQEEIAVILGYQSAWVYLIDEDLEYARVLTGGGTAPPASATVSRTFRIKGDAFMEEVLQANHIVVIEDAQTDPRTNKELVTVLGNRTIVVIPILLKHRRLGAISTGTFGTKGIKVPTPTELEYLEAMARHVAVVIDRIQFLHEREQAALALETSNQQLQTALVTLKTTQEEMVQRERLAAVGQLAAGIAHDFNNIMAVIVLYTQMGQNFPALPTKVQDWLQIILHQAWRAADLVQQILDFSRRAVMEPRPLDLLPFLKEQVKLLARTLPESIQLDLVYGSEAYTVNADPTRLQQAILNLVINARDAMPRGGKLTLNLLRAETNDELVCAVCQQIMSGQWVLVQVQDNGIGMSPATLLHIFEPFFTTKQAGQGSGLGLSQVAGIVHQHGGHITVESQWGKGTTFTLYIPALPAKPQEEESLPAAALPFGKGELVLVVEDDPATREALADSIDYLGYRTLAAANGQEALLILDQKQADITLVLSDVVMPEMGGQALFQAIQLREPKLPVILLTGHPLESDLQKLQGQGLAGWLLKPPSMEKLAHLLARAIHKTVS